jgi:hypothetical protein
MRNACTATKSSGLADIKLGEPGVKDRMYVSYWWRLDATNKFVAEPWIKKVNCVVGQAWGPEHWWIVNQRQLAQSLPVARPRPDARAGAGEVASHRREHNPKEQ